MTDYPKISRKKREKNHLILRGLNIRSVGSCLGFLQVAGGFTDNQSLMDQTDLLEIIESVSYSMYFYNTSEEQQSGEVEDLPDLENKDVQMVAKKMQLAFRSKFPKPMVKIEESNENLSFEFTVEHSN